MGDERERQGEGKGEASGRERKEKWKGSEGGKGRNERESYFLHACIVIFLAARRIPVRSDVIAV